MDNSTPNEKPENKPRVKLRPIIQVDCSKWVDTTTGNWTFGKFVIKKTAHPLIPMQFHGVEQEPPTTEPDGNDETQK